MNLKDYIIDKSKEIGIDIIGFTNTKKFKGIDKVLEVRRARNYETEFEEVDIEKRVSPKQILETGRSIIVIGMSYYIDIDEKLVDKKDNIKGKLSKSSIGIDYHLILKDKMEQLVSEIKKIENDFEYAVGVDTTPLLDRQLAKQAGIGWYGKNSNIINEQYGSFIFLGYIITELEIKQDCSVKDQCGDCNICIISCPVGAIKPNYQLNATRCISYLTQTKDDIPYDLRERMGIQLYGCDICQLVCPKNKDIIELSKENSKEQILDDGLLEYIDIEELFSMSNKDFKKKYGNMAFSWRGKNVIKRNGIIAIGNMGDKKNIPLLEKTLKDESTMIRKYSAWSLLKIDKIQGRDILETHERYEKDSSVLEEIEKLKKYFKIS